MRSSMFMVFALLALIAMPAHAADWGEAERAPEIVVVTTNRDGSARETTVWVVVLDGVAFVRTSGTPWGRNVARDADVVLRIAGTAYPARAELVLDEVLVARVQARFRQKYGAADRAARFVRFVMGGSRIYRVTAQ